MGTFVVTSPDGKDYEITAPEGATEEQVLKYAQESFASSTKQTPVEQPKTVGQELGRQVGLTGRALVQGLSAPVNVAADFLSGAYNVGANLLGSESRMPYLSKEQAQGLTAVGFPEPKNLLERSVQAGTQAMAGTAGTAIPKTILGENLIQQIPASGAAGLIAEPTASVVKGYMGDVTGSDLAATIASLGVGTLVGATAGKTAASLSEGKTPLVTMQDIQQKASRAYTKVSSLGIELTPQTATKIVDDVKLNLNNARFLPENAPSIQTILNKYDSVVSKGKVSFDELDQMRQLANDLKGDKDANVRRLAGVMVNSIDDQVAKLSPKDVSAGAGGIDEAVKTIMEARKDWRNLSRASTIENIINTAEIRAANPNLSEGELIRQGFINLAANKNKMKLFTEDEQNAIKAVTKGGSLDSFLSIISKFDPTRRNVLGAGAAVGATMKPEVGIPIMAAGIGAEQMQNLLRSRAAQKVQSGLLTGTTKPQVPSYGWRGLLSSVLNTPQ
jgi:hypothetical protein